MSDSTIKPNILAPRHPFVAKDGTITREWWRYLNEGDTFAKQTSDTVATTQTQIAAIQAFLPPPAGTASINPFGTVTEVDTGTGLAGGPITTKGTISIGNRSALTLMGNPQAFPNPPSDITIGAGLTLVGDTLEAPGAVSSIYAPWVNGDLPGPVLMADPFGQCIMCPIT